MSDTIPVEIAERNRPFLGETVSGDITVCVPCDGGLFLGIADVLGHGVQAHALAIVIEDFLRAHASAEVGRLARQLHEQLRGTRGAAAGLAYLDTGSGALTYVGIGNTRLHRLGPANVSLPSQPGTLGHQIRTPREQAVRLEPGALLVLTTDGVRERVAHEQHGAMLAADVQSIAAAILQRYGKDHDDASCIVLRYGNG